jgi:thioredoxin-related protein
VFVRANESEQPALFQEFGITGFPTLVFLNKDGNTVHKVVGGGPLAVILREMDKAMSAAG